MGQPEVASGIWEGQSRRSSRGVSEAVGQPTSPTGATYAARQNELKTLKALAPRPDEFLRKTEGTRRDFASCGTPVMERPLRPYAQWSGHASEDTHRATAGIRQERRLSQAV